MENEKNPAFAKASTFAKASVDKSAGEGKKVDDWTLVSSGESSDPNLNICESCQ